MSVLTRPAPIDFSAAKDPGFRARVVAEYERVKAWVGAGVDFDKARILDLGCGQGTAAASFALRHPGASVLGVDIEPIKVDELATAYRTQLDRALPANVSFATIAPGQPLAAKPFDVIYAWSVFEHVAEDQMVALFRMLKQNLAKNGRLFVQVDPLYFSPRGSHLYSYFKAPWHHLILPLDVLREGVMSATPTVKEAREWSQFMTLNRLTATDIIGRAKEAGLTLLRQESVTTDIVPPPRLTRIYTREALVTHEFMALFG